MIAVAHTGQEQAPEAEAGNAFHAVVAAEAQAVQAAVSEVGSPEFDVSVSSMGDERSVVSISFPGFAPALEQVARRTLRRIKQYAEELEAVPAPRRLQLV
jgi:hypothetical protein